MVREFITKAIGKSTNATIIRGRKNVPSGDDFKWWTSISVYVNRVTKEEYILEQLQGKYEMGFGQRELWNIIEKEYDIFDDYIMNVNHPKYDGAFDTIVFED